MALNKMDPGSVAVLYRREGEAYPSGLQSFTLNIIVDRKDADKKLGTGFKAVSIDDGAGGHYEATYGGTYKDYNQVRIKDVFTASIAEPAVGGSLPAGAVTILNMANSGKATAISALPLLSDIGAGS